MGGSITFFLCVSLSKFPWNTCGSSTEALFISTGMAHKLGWQCSRAPKQGSSEWPSRAALTPDCISMLKQTITVRFVFFFFFEKLTNDTQKTSLLTNRRNLVCWFLQENPSRVLPLKASHMHPIKRSRQGWLKRIGSASLCTQQSGPTSTESPPTSENCSFSESTY